MRSFFKGGLTRRIDCVVPFFCFDEQEAFVVTDMFLDSVRSQYALPVTSSRHVGGLFFDVTAAAVGEISKVCPMSNVQNMCLNK